MTISGTTVSGKIGTTDSNATAWGQRYLAAGPTARITPIHLDARSKFRTRWTRVVVAGDQPPPSAAWACDCLYSSFNSSSIASMAARSGSAIESRQ